MGLVDNKGEHPATMCFNQPMFWFLGGKKGKVAEKFNCHYVSLSLALTFEWHLLVVMISLQQTQIMT